MKYKVIDGRKIKNAEALEVRLNALSNEGWDLIGVCGKNNKILIFSRPSRN
jgi:hypothetical protein